MHHSFPEINHAKHTPISGVLFWLSALTDTVSLQTYHVHSKVIIFLYLKKFVKSKKMLNIPMAETGSGW